MIERGIVRLPATVAITASETNWNPVTGLTMLVEAGKAYYIEAMVMADVAAATSGLAIGFDWNPTTAPTRDGWKLDMASTATANDGGGWSGRCQTGSTSGGPTLPTTVPATTNNIIEVKGFIEPSVTQTLTLQIRGEESQDITVRRGRIMWEVQ
jgi:hypothetical protein